MVCRPCLSEKHIADGPTRACRHLAFAGRRGAPVPRLQAARFETRANRWRHRYASCSCLRCAHTSFLPRQLILSTPLCSDRACRGFASYTKVRRVLISTTMPPTTGTRTSTRQGRATVRPTNYYARTFAGRLAASGLEQTPETSSGAPGFLPALTHFTSAVDAFPKELIKHFSMFKEVEAKLHDPELMLEELLGEIAQQPTTTKAEQLAAAQNTLGQENNTTVCF